ncbi:MAG TPA: BTAD domain-containing putative transcriptional regulator [Pseudonocardiaceae bacterium]|jgi:DNA-binding SARP family transcriptional activator/tetratricopeptide (TPR) repeat protein|nr:BTAD domain-containing putative transcriptional regulator [Pseudonocardiaceae bacterium]
MRYEFRLLGPLEVRLDGRIVPVTSPKQRALLAALLVDANRMVSVDELANRLWDNESPSRNTLHSYVMRLRRTLGSAAPVLTRPDGYLIEVAPDALDTYEFETLVRQARGSADDRAAALLRQALDLWRGDPLADVPSAYLRREVAALWEERRLAAVESRVTADLRLGRHQDVATELAELTTRHPLRERFWAQRILGLHRSGRTAEALRCYTEVRTLLADELGTDPSPELRDLHQSILTDDPALAIPATSPHRNDLPGDISDFVGRAAEFDRLLAVLATSAKAVVISAIDGMAGIGKTTLAIHAAHRLADRYPDGQLFIDLRSHTEHADPVDPATALDTLLRALDVPADRIPAGLDERSALWRAELADRKVLVVLDNAGSVGQVRPLLPGSPTCLALITSRRRLADLDTTDTLSLDVLPEADALALFTSVVGADRVSADPESTSDVLRLCGHLPLAIRIAAARLRTRPTWPVRVLAERLRNETRDELAIGDRSVTAALDLSYRRLPEPQQRLFALLGQHPGTSFDSYQAAALGGLPLSEAERLLDELVDMHLVTEPIPGRYRFHDLVRQYAHAKEPTNHDAIDRLLNHYVYLARLTDFFLNPVPRHASTGLTPPGPVPDITDDHSAMHWCETELRNLMATVDYAAKNGWPHYPWQLTSELTWFFERRGHTADWVGGLQVAAKLVTDENDRAGVLLELGRAYHVAGRYREGVDVMADSLTIFQRLGNLRRVGAVLNNMGNTHLRMGQLLDAASDYEQALAVRNRAGDRPGTAVVLSNLCIIYQKLERFSESVDCGLQALDLYREAADRRGQGMAHDNLAVAYLRMSALEEAMAHGTRAVALAREVADGRGEAATLNTLGRIHRSLGDYTTALAYQRQALALALDIADFNIEAEVRQHLQETIRAAEAER